LALRMLIVPPFKSMSYGAGTHGLECVTGASFTLLRIVLTAKLLILNAGGGYHVLLTRMDRISVDLG
jgi:hypothetical protein